MRAGLDEAQARIKIAGRNINYLRYAADTTLMAESKQKLKSLRPAPDGSRLSIVELERFVRREKGQVKRG